MSKGKELLLAFIAGWAITAPVAITCGIAIGDHLRSSTPKHRAIGQDTYTDLSTRSITFRLHCGCTKTYQAESRLTITRLCDDHKRLESEQAHRITDLQSAFEQTTTKGNP